MSVNFWTFTAGVMWSESDSHHSRGERSRIEKKTRQARTAQFRIFESVKDKLHGAQK